MEEAGFLYQVISDFCTDKGDFSPEKISAVDMGYIYLKILFVDSLNHITKKAEHISQAATSFI